MHTAAPLPLLPNRVRGDAVLHVSYPPPLSLPPFLTLHELCAALCRVIQQVLILDDLYRAHRGRTCHCIAAIRPALHKPVAMTRQVVRTQHPTLDCAWPSYQRKQPQSMDTPAKTQHRWTNGRTHQSAWCCIVESVAGRSNACQRVAAGNALGEDEQVGLHVTCKAHWKATGGMTARQVTQLVLRSIVCCNVQLLQRIEQGPRPQ